MTVLSQVDPLPLYAQLAQQLRRRVGQGEWKGGDRLPSHYKLAEEYAVARVTVRQAIDLLEIDGTLTTRRGLGTFLTADPRVRRRMPVHQTLEALLTMMRAEPPDARIIEEREAMPQLQAHEGTPAPRYVLLRRLLKRESIPFDFHSVYIDRRQFDRAPERFRTRYTIRELVELPGMKLATARQIITCGTADLDAASQLRVVVNAPVVKIHRVFCDVEGVVIFLGESTHPADLVQLEMDLMP
jgi:GntR family transcriptional regulator